MSRGVRPFLNPAGPGAANHPGCRHPSPASSVSRRAAFFRRAALRLGSLFLAIFLLPLFAAVLFLGTLIESWHDRSVAEQLVYQTWWFVALLTLLGVNVFFAAAKKWPWQRHQIGFLITHLGLMTLVSGGLIDSLAGTQGTLVLVDSNDLLAASRGRRASAHFIDKSVHSLAVVRPGPSAGASLEAEFSPGPLAWSSEKTGAVHATGLTALLGSLARPLGPRRAWDLGDDARLTLLTYYPRARREPFRPMASAGPGFPAIEVQLASSLAGVTAPQWVAYHSGSRTVRMGPGSIEMLARGCREEQLAEFRQPPPSEQMGQRGQLVVGFRGQTTRLDVERSMGGKALALGVSGWAIRVLRFQPDFLRAEEKNPTNPAVTFELLGPDRRPSSFVTAARQAGELAPRGAMNLRGEDLAALWAWYHPPDYGHGESSIRAALQFATGAEEQLEFRSFHKAGTSKMTLEATGSATAGGDWQRIWSGMNWRFQVTNFLPRAGEGPYFVPVERGTAGDESEFPAALKCRLARGKTTTEFWLGKSDEGFTPVVLGGERYQVGYHPAIRDLGFEMELLRSEQTSDRGSGQMASQASFVAVKDVGQEGPGVRHHIRLNEPLAHRGYKIYQGGIQKLGSDENGKPYSRALFLVRHDPGLYFKYAGSAFLALGIATMFYMRAYFFKPRGRALPESLTTPQEA